jgi:hypothetical protein
MPDNPMLFPIFIFRRAGIICLRGVTRGFFIQRRRVRHEAQDIYVPRVPLLPPPSSLPSVLFLRTYYYIFTLWPTG